LRPRWRFGSQRDEENHSRALLSTTRQCPDEERAKLTSAIAAAGCSGGKLEFDHGKYEVDDAVCGDGQTYDLEFDADFRLIKKELEEKESED
jgi:hypothetical protein